MRVEQKTGVQIHGGFEHLINSNLKANRTP